MSTGADCYFVEKEPGQWWYYHQCYPYGVNEDYDENGPFTSFPKARTHLDENYANPGGYSIEAHPNGDGTEKEDA